MSSVLAGAPDGGGGDPMPVCQAVADPFGDHQVGCGENGDRSHRHNSLRDALYSAAQSEALAPKIEVLSLIPGSCSRPADVFHTGGGVSLLPWKSPSSPHYSSKPSLGHLLLKAMLSLWERNGRW